MLTRPPKMAEITKDSEITDMIINKLVYGVATILLFSISACSGDGSPTIATVGDAEIKGSDLRAALVMEAQNYDPALLTDSSNFESLRDRVLSRLIQEEILIAEANRLSITISDDDMKDTSDIRFGIDGRSANKRIMSAHKVDKRTWDNFQRRRMQIDKLIAHEVTDNIPVPDERIKEYYNKHAAQFRLPAQFRARQIVVDKREKAEEILAKIKRGDDFAELATKNSMTPDRERGGDLGYFDATSFPASFAETCQQLKIGELSDVITTNYGFQIFELIDKRPARQRDFSEMRPYILQVLREEKGEAAFSDWYKSLQSKTKVTIDDAKVKLVTIESLNL